MKLIIKMPAPGLFLLWSALLLTLTSNTYSQPRLVIPTGHVAPINTAEFSPDGKLFVTASDDGTAKTWDVKSGRVLHSLDGHSSDVVCAYFSPDGKMIVTGSYDNTSKIWETISGRILFSLEGHTNMIYSAVFNSDGKLVVTASGDETAKIWETSSGRLLHTLSGHNKSLKSARFSPDGKLIVTSSWDKTVKIWETTSGRLITTLFVKDYVADAWFSPNGLYVVAQGGSFMSSPDDKDVIIWEAATGKVVKTLEGHTRSIWTARYSPDGKMLITGSADGTAIIWDTETGKRLTLFDLQSRFSRWAEGVTSVKFTPDCQEVAIFTESRKWIKIFEASSGKLKKKLKTNSGVLSFSHDGKLLLTATALWDLTSGKKVYPLAGCSKQVSPKFSPDGKVIATISGPIRNSESIVKFWSMVNGKYTGKLVHPYPGKSNNDIETRTFFMKFSDDGRWILTYCFLSPSDLSFSSQYELLKIWDASKGKLVKTIDGYPFNILSAQFSPDSKWVAVSDVAGSVDIFNVSPPKLIKSINLEGWNEIDFSPDCQWMVTKTGESVSIWKTKTFEKIMSIDLELAWPVPCAFSLDFKLFAVAGGDAIIRIMETGNWKFMKSLKGHTDDLNCIEFSPDGRSILTGSKDASARIWDVASGTLIRTLWGHSDEVEYARYSPDMKWVITSSYNKTINIWNPETGKIIKTIFNREFEGIDWSTNRILTSNESEVSIFTLLDDKPLLSFVIIGENDWVVTHWSGLFDASPGAMKQLYFIDNQDIIELDKLKEKYYEPGLWEKSISGKALRFPGN